MIIGAQGVTFGLFHLAVLLLLWTLKSSLNRWTGFQPGRPERKRQNGEKRQSDVTKEEEEEDKKKFLHTIISRLSQSGLFVLLRYFFVCIPISTLCCFIFSTRDGIVRSSNDKWINRKQKKEKKKHKQQSHSGSRWMFPMIAGRFRFVNCSFIFLPQTFFTSLWLVETKKKKQTKNWIYDPPPKWEKGTRRGCWKCRRTNKFRSDLHDSLLPPFPCSDSGSKCLWYATLVRTSDTVLLMYTQGNQLKALGISLLHCTVESSS